MQVVDSRAGARAWVEARRDGGGTTGLVPTMGSLHEGHASLLRIGRENSDHLALSIFVNPLQFGPGEDLERYPRNLEADLEVARKAGVDLVFAPTAAEMYPAGEPWVRVVPVSGADRLCGRSRPGHFEGVLTVVAKLFGILQPDVAVFGRKDFQQLALIRRMVIDLDMAIRLMDGPTVRDPDGLALSSRNQYLSAVERERALALSRALAACQALHESGEENPAVYREAMQGAAVGGVELEYAEVVDAATLAEPAVVERGTVCAIAARVGSTRLIDNTVLGIDRIDGAARGGGR